MERQLILNQWLLNQHRLRHSRQLRILLALKLRKDLHNSNLQRWLHKQHHQHQLVAVATCPCSMSEMVTEKLT